MLTLVESAPPVGYSRQSMVQEAETPAPLLPRIAAGDRDAVGECMRRYGNLVWSLARRFLADQAEAEEAVQEIFIDLWSHAGRFNPEIAGEVTFVAMVARRRLIDRLRKSGREPGREELQPHTATVEATALDEIEVRDEAERAKRLMSTLKPEQRQVLKLSIWEGLSHSTISERTGMPLGTVKTHMRRGLLSLRKRMEGTSGRPPSREESR